MSAWQNGYFPMPVAHYIDSFCYMKYWLLDCECSYFPFLLEIICIILVSVPDNPVKCMTYASGPNLCPLISVYNELYSTRITIIECCNSWPKLYNIINFVRDGYLAVHLSIVALNRNEHLSDKLINMNAILFCLPEILVILSAHKNNYEFLISIYITGVITVVSMTQAYQIMTRYNNIAPSTIKTFLAGEFDTSKLMSGSKVFGKHCLKFHCWYGSKLITTAYSIAKELWEWLTLSCIWMEFCSD